MYTWDLILVYEGDRNYRSQIFNIMLGESKEDEHQIKDNQRQTEDVQNFTMTIKQEKVNTLHASSMTLDVQNMCKYKLAYEILRNGKSG